MGSRSRAAALAVLTIGSAAALIGTLATAQAAPARPATVRGAAFAALATPVTTEVDGRTLIVDPTTDLAAEGAAIRVEGTGFATTTGLYVAVCADGSGAPGNLGTCVGGGIPDDNDTQSWAHVTESGEGGGGVPAQWGPDGSFSVTITLASVTDGLNCVTGACALYTASDDATDRSQDTAVPLTFAGSAPTSSSAPPSTPGTAIPQVIQSPEITAGGTQLIVFSGFEPNEQVALTLFSAEVTLSPVDADSTGVARAQFTVPSDFAVGSHRLEAIGQRSGTLGVASFEVVPPPTTPPTTPPSSSSSPESSSSSAESSSSSAPATSSSSAPTVTSSSAAADTSSDSSLWWLWLILALVVIGAIITGIVVYRRNQQLARDRDQYERDQAAAAAAQQAGPGQPGGADPATMYLPPVPPPPGTPPPGADPYGLLSGQDMPYGGPTDVIVPGGPTQVIGPPAGYQPPPEPPGGPEGPPTEEIPTVPPAGGDSGATGGSAGTGATAGSGDTPPTPGADRTSSWTPDFDDDASPGDDPGPDERPPAR